MSLITDDIKSQLKGYFDKIQNDIKIVSFLEKEDLKSNELDSFLNDVANISDKVSYEKNDFDSQKDLANKYGISRKTSFTLLKDNNPSGIIFSGIPGGHEFNSFILALLNLAGLGSPLDEDKIQKINSFNKNYNVETFISLSCTHCPEVVQALNQISLNSDKITTTMVDSAVFHEESKDKNIQAVPSIFINGEFKAAGEKNIDQLIELIQNS